MQQCALPRNLLAIVVIMLVLGTRVDAGQKPSLGYWGLFQNQKEYRVAIDERVRHNGKISASVESTVRETHEFCNFMQIFNAEKFRGKRIRFSGFVKTSKVTKWAGLWMRVDGELASPALAFDNMEQRPIKGTTGWTACSVVLDVPAGAVDIALGLILGGTGKAWVSDMKFEIVSTRVPVTGAWYNKRKSAPSAEKNPFDKTRWGYAPMNLDLLTPEGITPLLH